MVKIEKGVIVTVYEDPITQENIEGVAVVKEVISRDSGEVLGRDLVRCVVRFLDKDTRKPEPEEYEREILEPLS